MIDEGRKETRELLNAIRIDIEESRKEFRELMERMDKRHSEQTVYTVREE